jgi:hypothetical protein
VSLNYLKDLKPTEITIVGGVAAVSAQVEEKLQALFPEANFRRFGGFDQYETSAIIANALFGDTSPNLFAATGTNFPDALAGFNFCWFDPIPHRFSNIHNNGLAAVSNGWIYYPSSLNNNLLYDFSAKSTMKSQFHS